VIRRRLTVKRIDPWSVLKLAAVANLALLGIGLLFAYVVWFVIDRLNIVDQVCGIATDVGFTRCGLEAASLFRTLLQLGLLGVVVMTAVAVFLAFLHNLIADLTGGLAFSVVDDTRAAATLEEARPEGSADQQPRRQAAPPPARVAEPDRTTVQGGPTGQEGGRSARRPVAAPRGRPGEPATTSEDLFGER